MTSNIGTSPTKDFGTVLDSKPVLNLKTSKRRLPSFGKCFEKSLAPEFLNRIDDVIIFNSLEREDIHKIIDIELQNLYERVENLVIALRLAKLVKIILLKRLIHNMVPDRKRAIQKYVEDELAEELIKNTNDKARNISVDYDKEKDKIIIDIKAEK